MKYQLITGTYSDNNDIILYCRDENGKRVDIKAIGFDPYFYVPRDEVVEDDRIVSQTPVGFASIYEDKLDKIITKRPKDVGGERGTPGVREKFSKHFEADVIFIRRMLVDTGIFSGLELPENKTVIRYDKIRPVDFQMKPRFTMADIETLSEDDERHPKPTSSKAKVIINCVYDSYTNKYLSFVVDSKKRVKRDVWTLSENHQAIIVPSESDLLDLTKQYLETVDSDIFSAWYLDFDKDYLDIRAEKKKLHFPWKRTNTFDLLAPYKRLYAKGSGKLADVVKMEELDVPNFEPFSIEFWKNDLKRAVLCNKSHVEAIVKLNEKLHLLEFYWDLKNLVGFEDMNPTIYHGMLAENLSLRWYHNKWVLPSKPSNEEKERRKRSVEKKVGGKVLTPPFGIFENVGVVDMSRYYIEMLIAQNLSPEPHNPDELGIYPKMALWIINERLKYDVKLKKLTPGTPEYENMKYRRDSVKFVTETIIGSLGSESSRVFNLDMFNSVTKMGQRGMIFLQKTCDSDGKKVIYYDTDGASIKIPDVNAAKEYVIELNEKLKDFCKEEKINRELTLKLDRYFKKILFKKVRERVDGKWVERGAKKRYCGLCTWESGKECNYLKIVGFEYVRSNASPVTKNIQPSMFDLMLTKETKDVSDFLKSEVTRVKNLINAKNVEEGNSWLDDIAIPVTLSKHPDVYGKKDGNKIKGVPDYARGAKYCNEWFGTDIRGDDQVRMVFVKKIEGYPKTDVISYLSAEEIPVKVTVDIEKTIDRIFKMPLEDIIDLVGLSWDEIFTPHKSLFNAFGG